MSTKTIIPPQSCICLVSKDSNFARFADHQDSTDHFDVTSYSSNVNNVCYYAGSDECRKLWSARRSGCFHSTPMIFWSIFCQINVTAHLVKEFGRTCLSYVDTSHVNGYLSVCLTVSATPSVFLLPPPPSVCLLPLLGVGLGDLVKWV